MYTGGTVYYRVNTSDSSIFSEVESLEKCFATVHYHIPYFIQKNTEGYFRIIQQQSTAVLPSFYLCKRFFEATTYFSTFEKNKRSKIRQHHKKHTHPETGLRFDNFEAPQYQVLRTKCLTSECEVKDNMEYTINESC